MTTKMQTVAKPSLFFLATLGVVYGDIGTSPLYAMKTCFSLYNIPVIPDNIMGIISLIFWSLVIVVSFKYIRLILSADNQGEGGILSLLTLCSQLGAAKTRRKVLFIGLIGAALFYGDGIITPAISVLGALEGLEVISPDMGASIPYMAVGILVALFIVQKHGTHSIGSLFGPVMIIWFLILSLLGLYQIALNPSIIAALNPYYGFLFIFHNGISALLTFGAIVLVVTGVEALYADLGHFNVRSIRMTWAYCVFPALTLNYLGQGALLLTSAQNLENPFYLMAPSWAMYPLIILATLATIIASQAIISGIFSMSWQAIQLDYFPRLRVIHTSDKQYGQVYLPVVNYLLLIGTLLAVMLFQTSSNLAAAYGIAITGIMLITSTLAMSLAHYKWKWSLMKMVIVFTPILMLDFLYFSSSMVKFFKGGWLPILIAALVYTIISSWRYGRKALSQDRSFTKEAILPFVTKALEAYPTRIPGTAIFMSRSSKQAPITLEIHLKHNKFLHEKVLFISILTKNIPRVKKADRLEIRDYGDNIYHVIANYGFVEVPNLHYILTRVKKEGIKLDDNEITFFLSRALPVASSSIYLTGVEESIFIFLAHNAVNATDYFKIPYDQVIEYGVRFEV